MTAPLVVQQDGGLILATEARGAGGVADTVRRFAVLEKCPGAFHHYRLTRYAVDYALLKADHVWPVFSDDYYWSDYISGRADILTVPGNHHTMFAADNAPILAAKLARLLDERAP